MTKKYYLHRISHEDYVSYSLMNQGYLTLGWNELAGSGILEAAKEKNNKFDSIAKKYGAGNSRSRWSMWYFARMNIGDIIVVPLYNSKFSVFEICDIAKSIYVLEKDLPLPKVAWTKNKIVWKEGSLYDETDNRKVDLGFYISVKPIVENVPRNFVEGRLVSRMKIRQTNGDITDIKEYVDSAIEAGKKNEPITLYKKAVDPLVEKLKEYIWEVLNPDKFEELIKWYLEKCGAKPVEKLPKNDSQKEDGADADVMAVFENLKHIIYVQAKHHKGKTSNWAVEQISRYKDQKSEGDSSYTYASWVISAGDTFSDTAIRDAEEKGVRLIDGDMFARMLLDIGFLGLDEVDSK